MSRLAPATCALAGALAILAGTVLASAFVIRQTHCEASQVLLAHPPGCAGDTIGSAIGWVLLVLGAVAVVLGAVLSTPLFAERRRRSQPRS